MNKGKLIVITISVVLITLISMLSSSESKVKNIKVICYYNDVDSIVSYIANNDLAQFIDNKRNESNITRITKQAPSSIGSVAWIKLNN